MGTKNIEISHFGLTFILNCKITEVYFSFHSLDLYFIFNWIYVIQFSDPYFKQDFDVSAKYTQKCLSCKHRTYIVCYLSAYVRNNHAT